MNIVEILIGFVVMVIGSGSNDMFDMTVVMLLGLMLIGFGTLKEMVKS